MWLWCHNNVICDERNRESSDRTDIDLAYLFIVQVYEVLDNAIDEAQAGFADTVDIIVHTDGSVTISDNGRGVRFDSFMSVRLYYY